MVEISQFRIEEENHRRSNSTEEDEEDEEEEGDGSRKKIIPIDPRRQYRRDSSRERLERQEEAKKRWKILCIVRTADVESDETARQEKIQERVDEWMTGFMAKMRIQSEEEEPVSLFCSHIIFDQTSYIIVKS